jgi:hypothetical protein
MLTTVSVVFRFCTAGTEQGGQYRLFGLDFGGRRRQSLVGDARFTVRGMLSKLAYKVLVFFAAVHHCIYAQRWEGRGGEGTTRTQVIAATTTTTAIIQSTYSITNSKRLLFQLGGYGVGTDKRTG